MTLIRQVTNLLFYKNPSQYEIFEASDGVFFCGKIGFSDNLLSYVFSTFQNFFLSRDGNYFVNFNTSHVPSE